MNFKIVLCFSFVFYLSTGQSTAFLTSPFSTEIDFSKYRNRSESDLVDDTNVNWVRTDYKNAYVCQGQQIKSDPHLLALLPRNGEFMISYIYARPKFGQSLTGDLITYPLTFSTTKAFVDFTYSQDQQTILRVFLWRKSDGNNRKLIWQNRADSQTPGIVAARALISDLNGQFRLVFQAEVEAIYPYTSRTYLSQVVIDRVIVNAH